MSRPLRIQFCGAVYHVTARGDRREAIFLDDLDRCVLTGLLEESMARFDAIAHAWCLMGNHYHLMVQTQEPNLSCLMRHINGVYTQRFNRRHAQSGHVFQGRFHAVLVDTDRYLRQACRYVELNPVRAGLIDDPLDWAWSSARARTGRAASPPWLTPHPFGTDHEALEGYRQFLLEGVGAPLWETGLRQQIYLGSPEFVQRAQAFAANARRPGTTAPARPTAAAHGVPRIQQRTAVPLTEWLPAQDEADAEAIRRAHHDGGWTLTAIAAHLGVAVSTVSRRMLSAPVGRPGHRGATNAKNET